MKQISILLGFVFYHYWKTHKLLYLPNHNYNNSIFHCVIVVYTGCYLVSFTICFYYLNVYYIVWTVACRLDTVWKLNNFVTLIYFCLLYRSPILINLGLYLYTVFMWYKAIIICLILIQIDYLTLLFAIIDYVLTENYLFAVLVFILFINVQWMS